MKLNSSPLLIDFLKHIQSEMLFIIQQTAAKDLEQIFDDPTLQRALTHSLLVIGEACKRTPTTFAMTTRNLIGEVSLVSATS